MGRRSSHPERETLREEAMSRGLAAVSLSLCSIPALFHAGRVVEGVAREIFFRAKKFMNIQLCVVRSLALFLILE